MSELMQSTVAQDEEQYNVVINHEEQYSIWVVGREIPLGWRAVGVSGSKEVCLEHIEKVWTDMRPLSLRLAMEKSEAERAAGSQETVFVAEPAGESLVERLAKGTHPVRMTLSRNNDISEIRQAISRGYTFVEFTGTKGGTELGIKLIPEACDLSSVSFEDRAGTLVLSGSLVLDSVPVRCNATIDLATLTGMGHLVIEGQTA
jgi:uncharacterized protein YbdZ (MbtH family)